jgi:hypothetical protein
MGKKEAVPEVVREVGVGGGESGDEVNFALSTDKAKDLFYDKSNRTFNLSKIHTLIH